MAFVLLVPVLLVLVALMLGVASTLRSGLLGTLHVASMAGMRGIATFLAATAQQTVEQTHDAVLLGRRVRRA